MIKAIKDILNINNKKERQLEMLEALEKEIQIVKDIINGKYKYCYECNDYYLTESFLTNVETIDMVVCTYKDPINSSGNEYTKRMAKVTYSICPKGHKKEISCEEIC